MLLLVPMSVIVSFIRFVFYVLDEYCVLTCVSFIIMLLKL